MKRPKRRWVTALMWFGVFAAVMLGISAFVLSQWSQSERVNPDEAAGSFAGALAGAAVGPAYVTISEEGEMTVHRELESDDPVKLSTLHVMTWEPDSAELVRMYFPFWFVKLKLNRTVNLGLFISVMLRDWRGLDIDVSDEDLVARGPGLVLDHTTGNARRILIWSE